MAVSSTIDEKSVTIASGETDSDAATIAEDEQVVGIQLPAEALTGTKIMFLVSSDDGSTFVKLYDDAGAAVSVTNASGSALRTQWVDPRAFLMAEQIKLQSDAAEASDRALKILVSRVK